MVDPAEKGLTVSLTNDNRSRVWVRSSLNIVKGHRGSGSRTQATVGLSLQPSARLRLSFDPVMTWEEAGAQYVAST